MKKAVRFAVVAALVAGLFGMGSAVSPANAAPGCPTGISVVPSLNPTYPGVNINVCVNELGVNAEVGLVPGVDLNSLFVGTQAQTVCIYNPLATCAMVNSGRTGVDVDLPGPNPVEGPLGTSGNPCVSTQCVFLYVSGNGGSITVLNQGAVVVSVPLSLVCVRYETPRSC